MSKSWCGGISLKNKQAESADGSAERIQLEPREARAKNPIAKVVRTIPLAPTHSLCLTKTGRDGLNILFIFGETARD